MKKAIAGAREAVEPDVELGAARQCTKPTGNPESVSLG